MLYHRQPWAAGACATPDPKTRLLPQESLRAGVPHAKHKESKEVARDSDRVLLTLSQTVGCLMVKHISDCAQELLRAGIPHAANVSTCHVSLLTSTSTRIIS